MKILVLLLFTVCFGNAYASPLARYVATGSRVSEKALARSMELILTKKDSIDKILTYGSMTGSMPFDKAEKLMKQFADRNFGDGVNFQSLLEALAALDRRWDIYQLTLLGNRQNLNMHADDSLVALALHNGIDSTAMDIESVIETAVVFENFDLAFTLLRQEHGVFNDKAFKKLKEHLQSLPPEKSEKLTEGYEYSMAYRNLRTLGVMDKVTSRRYYPSRLEKKVEEWIRTIEAYEGNDTSTSLFKELRENGSIVPSDSFIFPSDG